MNTNKSKIFSLIKKNQKKIEAFGVKRLGLFGSFIKGKQNKKSDIDLLVEFYPGKKNFDNFINLSFFLEKSLQKKVDLITPESLSPYIKPTIMHEVNYVLCGI